MIQRSPVAKLRLDWLLVEQGHAATRTQAQALIMAGRVYLGERRLDKPGMLLLPHPPLTVRKGEAYVSRGGHKLAGALADLQLEVTGAVVADLGASTGGFTDCLLQHGAEHVYAVDVGRGLLADKLLRDARVSVMDGVNARTLTRASFPRPPSLVVVDASFIGLEKLLPAIWLVLQPGGRLLALVKPQFEVGREAARRTRGVVREPALREAAIQKVRADLKCAGFKLEGEACSKLAGPKGNVEHFLLATRTDQPLPSL